MAKKKVKRPPGRGGARRRSGNTGWWAGITAVVLLGVTLIVVSRGERAAADIVRELEVPSIAAASEVTLQEIAVEPFDRVSEGDTIATFEADGETASLEAPVDGFVVSLSLAEGDSAEPGQAVGTVQTGPAFDATNELGHHWHIAYGLYVCDTWLPPVGEFQGNLHTHGDGLIHAHPLSNAEAGERATVGRFFENGGMSISGSRVSYSDGETYRSGDVDCDGEPGVLKWAVNGEVREGDPGDLVIGNGDVLAIAFVPEGEDFPTLPPTTGQLQDYAAAKHPDVTTTTTPPAPADASDADAADDAADPADPADAADPAETTTTAPADDADAATTTTASSPDGEGADSS